jgi:hypothetical protein
MSKQVNTTRTTDDEHQPQFWWYCFSLLLLGAVAFCWVSALSYVSSDPPNPDYYKPSAEVANRCGIIGSYIAYYMHYWLGVGAYASLVCLSLWSLRLICGKPVPYWPWRLTGMFVLTASISGAAHMIEPMLTLQLSETYAGVMGEYTGMLLENRRWIGGCNLRDV